MDSELGSLEASDAQPGQSIVPGTPPDPVADPAGPEDVIACLNCGAPLPGTWCPQCGQKHLAGPPTLGLFMAELFTTLTDIDSRFWRTLSALLLKPGFLAREFFDGRRARYLPPVRLYLAVSLLFFLFLSVTTNNSISVTVSPVDDVTDEEQVPISEQMRDLLATQLRAELESSETIDEEAAAVFRERLIQLEAYEASDEDCTNKYSGLFEEQLSPRIEAVCRQVKLDGGYALAQSFLSKLPTAMFFMMPLFAACMVPFYWRPKRYFTEHFVLQVNNHSAIFLFALVVSLIGLVLGGGLGGWLALGTLVYALLYSYRSMGRFYGQNRRRTRLKFMALMLVYFTLLLFVLGFASAALLLGF